MNNSYEIQLGIKFNDAELKDIKNQLNNLTDNTHRIRIDIDNSRLLKQIEHAKKELKGLNDTKGSTKTSLNINTKSVEESLGRVEMALNEIGKSLNALDDKSGIKSLVSSVNQITTVLGKAEDESDSLMKSLSALSKKDFSINLNLKAGNANPVKSMADYGDEVRNNVIPQLEKRVDYFRKALGGYENAKSELTRLMTSKYGAKGADRATNLTDALGDDSSLSKQMNAYKRYLDYMQEIVSKKNALLLNDYNFQFSVSPEELIADAKKIQSGTKDVEESFEKLKGVFKTGIDGEALAAQIESVINKLEEVRKTIESLSKTTAFDGLANSFKELSGTLNNLLDNYILVKKNLDGIGDGLSGSGTTGIGFENIESDLKEVSSSAKAAEIAIQEAVNEAKKLNKVSIDISDGNIDNLRNTLKNIGFDDTNIERATNELTKMNAVAQKVSVTLKDGNLIKWDISGIEKTEDGLERIVALSSTLKKDKWVDTTKYGQFMTNDFEKLKSLAKDISDIKIDILKSDDASDINKLVVKLNELEKEYDELFSTVKLSNKQQIQLDNVVKQGNEKVLKEFNNELNEFVKLSNQIESKKFEIGKLGIQGGKDNEVVELKRQLEELEDTYNRLMGTFMKKVSVNGDIIPLDSIKNLENGIAKATENAENKLREFKAHLEDTRVKAAKEIKIDIEVGNYDNQISQMYEKFNKLSYASKELRDSVAQVENAYRQMELALNGTGDEVADRERLIQAEKKYAEALEKTNNLIRIQAREENALNDAQKLANKKAALKLDMANYLKDNSKAAKEFGDEIRRLSSLLDNLDDVGVNGVASQFDILKKKIKNAGKEGLTVFDKLKSKAKEYMAYLSAAEIFMYVEQAMREMFNTVLEIDTAMTGLYRVTDLTASEYEALFDNMIGSAKEYGATLNDIINATTDWVRAGFDANTSLGLAEVTTMYQHISDLDYDTAAENLITAYNGFKDELNNLYSGDQVAAVQYIADIFNELDNNFAVTSAGLGEALTRSASALDLAGNSIQETAGMVTGIVEVTQDPEKAGSALKVLSLRLRGKRIMPPYKESLYALFELKCNSDIEDNYICQSARVA